MILHGLVLSQAILIVQVVLIFPPPLSLMGQIVPVKQEIQRVAMVVFLPQHLDSRFARKIMSVQTEHVITQRQIWENTAHQIVADSVQGDNSMKARGFTLIELILVTAIVGLFAAGTIAVLNPSQQVQKANDSKRKTDLEMIQRALEAYYADNGRYPASFSNMIHTTQTITWGSSWQPYMDVLPKDPNSNRRYVYGVSSDGQTYGLYASLERGTDPQACHSNGSACDSLSTFGISLDPAGSCKGGICNYGVTSPNINP